MPFTYPLTWKCKTCLVKDGEEYLLEAFNFSLHGDIGTGETLLIKVVNSLTELKISKEDPSTPKLFDF